MSNGTTYPAEFVDLYNSAASRSTHVESLLFEPESASLSQDAGSSRVADASCPEKPDRVKIASAPRLRDLPSSEKPRERLRDLGPQALSSAELIAALLGSGNRTSDVKALSESLIAKYEGLQMLSRASWWELTSVEGINDAKAAQLLAAFELGRRSVSALAEPEIRQELGAPWQIAQMMMPLLRDKTREEMWIILLDVRNGYRGKYRMYEGCVDQMVVNCGEVLGVVLERKCPRFAIVHNHPSGNGEPSVMDLNFTKQLLDAARMLELELMDHIVIGADGWVSMRTSELVDFQSSPRVD